MNVQQGCPFRPCTQWIAALIFSMPVTQWACYTIHSVKMFVAASFRHLDLQWPNTKFFFFLATDYCVYRKQELSFFSREKKRSRPSLLGCSTHEFPEGPQRQLAMATTANSEDLEHTLPRNGYIGAFGHFVLFVFVRVRIPSKSIFVETISHYKCV